MLVNVDIGLSQNGLRKLSKLYVWFIDLLDLKIEK